jgi:hypothetical protein
MTKMKESEESSTGFESMVEIYEKRLEKYIQERIKTALTEYTNFLLKYGYCDSDVYTDGNSAIDRFMHPNLRDK